MRGLFIVVVCVGVRLLQEDNISFCHTDRMIYYPNKSACEPVSVNRSISSFSFCFQTNSQSPLIWHSHKPVKLPLSLWGWYCGGSVPVSQSKRITLRSRDMLSPLFSHFLKSLLNLLVVSGVYFILQSNLSTFRLHLNSDSLFLP